MSVRLTAREQRMLPIVVILGLVILAVYMIYILGPISRALTGLRSQVQVARGKLKGLETVTANEAALQEQYRLLDKSVTELRKMMPAEEELPAVIALLTDLASQSQVKIQSISPQRTAEGATPSGPGAPKAAPEASVYTEVAIQIDALAGYHQFGSFLSLIETSEKPMRLSNLRISSVPKEPKRHQIRLVIVAYFATTESLHATPQATAL